MWIAQAIGIEALVGLTLAAGEAHVTFSFSLGCQQWTKRG
jgi:hypothetical protein